MVIVCQAARVIELLACGQVEAALCSVPAQLTCPKISIWSWRQASTQCSLLLWSIVLLNVQRQVVVQRPVVHWRWQLSTSPKLGSVEFLVSIIKPDVCETIRWGPTAFCSTCGRVDASLYDIALLASPPCTERHARKRSIPCSNIRSRASSPLSKMTGLAYELIGIFQAQTVRPLLTGSPGPTARADHLSSKCGGADVALAPSYSPTSRATSLSMSLLQFGPLLRCLPGDWRYRPGLCW